MRKWWRSYKLVVPEPVQCGSTYVIFTNDHYADVVYICDEDEGHGGLHMDKVERKAWTQENLRLRTVSDTTSDERKSTT
jgi:hypothetical protein